MAGNRRSQDPQERMEWQLDQIRQNTLIVGVVAGLALAGAALAAFAALLG